MKLNYSQMSTIKCNKARYRRVIAELDGIVNGRYNSIVPFVTDKYGESSEMKIKIFMDKMIRSLHSYADQTNLWRNCEDKMDAGAVQADFDRYIRLYLEIMVRRVLLIDSSPYWGMKESPCGSFQELISGCVDFHSEKDKDTLLADYYCYGFGMMSDDIVGWCIDMHVQVPDSPTHFWISPEIRERMDAVVKKRNLVFGPEVDEGPIERAPEEEIITQMRHEDENYVEFYEKWDVICDKFTDFMDLIYSGKIPIAYLSKMSAAVEGMVDTFLYERNMSLYDNDDDMDRAITYIDKTIEKCRLLIKSRGKNRKKYRG